MSEPSASGDPSVLRPNLDRVETDADINGEVNRMAGRLSWIAQDLSQPLSPGELLVSHGARRWYLGAGIAVLIWGFNSLPALFASGGSSGSAWTYLGLNLLMLIGFMFIPPLSWGRSQAFKLSLLILLIILAAASILFLGRSGGWFATFITVCAAMQQYRRRTALTIMGTVVVLIIIGQLLLGASFEDAFSMAAVAGSIGLMMVAFSRQIEALRVLRSTQQELADVAVKEERNRVARDMHDILGHSLTVIAVKAELAGRLIEAAQDQVIPEQVIPDQTTPEQTTPNQAAAKQTAVARAAIEIREVEDLARGALADVRATVSGYRGVNVLSELANARTALAAGGIDAELPGAADEVPAKYRELFGWTLREGTTNIVRHAHASRVKVTMGSGFIQIDDDGVGLSGQQPPSSANGLAGLRERVEAQGASLSIGRSGLGEHGGFRLRVDL